MVWNLVGFAILIVGCLGFNLVYLGLLEIFRNGFRTPPVCRIVGGLIMAAPLSFLIWLVIWFHYHPLHIG